MLGVPRREIIGTTLANAPPALKMMSVEYKPIEEVFIRQAYVIAVVVAGRKIATTAEHPFYVQDRGWVPAGQLRVGDWVHSHDGQWTPVTAVELTGTPAQVYNFRIADHHTYFVGDDDWGFSVWVHNNNYSRNRASMPIDEAIESGALSVKGSRAPTHFDGKTGKPSTQLQNMELMAELESRGWTVTNGAAPGYTEEFIPGIGGLLSSSPDITAVKVFRRRERVLRINTVTIDSKGVPIDGELSQAIRIRHFGALKDARGTAHLLLVPKRS